ncbi:MAG: hypothetical protein WEC72_02575, partial [Chthoniobacterales bacterium]
MKSSSTMQPPGMPSMSSMSRFSRIAASENDEEAKEAKDNDASLVLPGRSPWTACSLDCCSLLPLLAPQPAAGSDGEAKEESSGFSSA